MSLAYFVLCLFTLCIISMLDIRSDSQMTLLLMLAFACGFAACAKLVKELRS